MQTWEEIENLIRDIPTQTLGGTQPKRLFKLAHSLKGVGDVVEIGANAGKSTIALSFARKLKSAPPIYSIDVQRHPDLETNLTAANVKDFVRLLHNSSLKSAKKWDRPIELLWIDGDHSYAGLITDLKAWSKHVVEGGYLAVHDYPGDLQSVEVWRALHRHVLSRPTEWRVVSDRVHGSLIIFRRISSFSKTGIRPWLYWQYRNIRANLLNRFPRIGVKVWELLQ